MKNKTTVNADTDPQNITIGKWKFSPITLNTAILLEQIDSPFMRQPVAIEGSGEQLKDKKTHAPVIDKFGQPVIDPSTIEYVKNIPTVTELARTLYILLHADNPKTLDIIDDQRAFRNAVSALAREMTLADMAAMTNRINGLMSAAQTAIKESDMEGDGPKKGTGHLS